MATSWLQTKNNAAGTLNTGIDNDDTSVILDSGQGANFPSAYPFDVTIDSEILRVTNRSTDTLTVTRAQQGTSAASHTAGATVELRVTAGIVSQVQTSLGTLEDGAALLAGRSGGQTLIGGTGASDSLTLKPSSAGSPTGSVNVPLTDVTQAFEVSVPTNTVTSAGFDAAILVGQGGTLDIGNAGAWRSLLVSPAITYSSNTPNNAALQVFSFGPTITAPVSPLQMRGATIFRDLPTITMGTPNTAHGSISTSGRPWITLRQQHIFTAQTGSETATYPTLKFSAAAITVGTGWTITDYLLHHVEVPGGSGTITNMVALQLDDYGSRATNPYSVKSAGALVRLQHAGPGVFGADAAPASTGVGLEVSGTTKAFLPSRLTTTQRDALDEAVGMVVWNTTAGKLQVCTATGSPGTWADLH